MVGGGFVGLGFFSVEDSLHLLHSRSCRHSVTLESLNILASTGWQYSEFFSTKTEVSLCNGFFSPQWHFEVMYSVGERGVAWEA